MNTEITQTRIANQAPEDIILLFKENLTPSEHSIFYILYGYACWYKNPFPSNKKVAARAKCCRETVKRAKKKFRMLGIMDWVLDHAPTPVYRLHKIFSDEKVIQRIKIYLPTVLGFTLFLNLLKPLQFKNVPLLVKRIVKIIYLKPLSLSLSRGRARSGEELSNEALTMESRDLENFITPALRQATETLVLTKWGQIRLCAFEDKVLEHALQQLKFAHPKSPFNWFFKVCLEYCTTNKVAPDWDFMKALSTKYNMPENAEFSKATSRSITASASPQASIKGKVGEASTKELFPVYKASPADSNWVAQERIQHLALLRSKEKLTIYEQIILDSFSQEFGDEAAVAGRGQMDILNTEGKKYENN